MIPKPYLDCNLRRLRSKFKWGHSDKINEKGYTNKYSYFNVVLPIGNFLSFWSNINLVHLKTFSCVLILKEMNRWDFKTLAKSSWMDEFLNQGEPWALRRRIWYRNVKSASNFQDYRYWHDFLQGSYWNGAWMGKRLPVLTAQSKNPQSNSKLHML